ncbi:hypothetical protein KC19_10G084600 [Ceratodon purpureus]|uniref:Protein kinase domain-containing protein n=1 Tax=Ceratodon purpureus TaxID=3225 RepID=A0A8T0GI61_CERPU|nr:hypothetical protein KC19_10G084600 [Ceratodon purpureus]
MGNSCACMRQSGEASASTPSNTGSSVQQQIERSKTHWSTLADGPSGACMAENEGEGECEAQESNKQEFMQLQRHPTWGYFFSTFIGEDENLYDDGELVVGEKFAEGGQAELFHAKVTWSNPKNNEMDENNGTEYVVKVFKKGTFLRDLKSQLPHGLLQHHVEAMENYESLTPKVTPRFICQVHRGILLENGQFAFLMQKEHFDLRTLIERNMGLRSGRDCGPFSKEDSEVIMYSIALGVEWLHNHDIIHRDLKASNVLVNEQKSTRPMWQCFVADYECSNAVVGTGFFRAPEILRALKERTISQKPEVFSRAADIYAYGMTCYEVLTGKLPFEDHPLHDQTSSLIDEVINDDLRPEIPKCVKGWACNLLNECWQSDPKARPSVGEILDLLPLKSASVRRWEKDLKRMYGETYRDNFKHQV